MIWSAGVDGRCDHVNAAWCAFTGRPPSDALGEGWQASIHPEDLGPYRALYFDHFERRAAYETDCRVRRYDGVHCSLVVHAAPRATAGGDFAGFVAAYSAAHDGAAGEAHAGGDFFELLLDHVCVAGFDGYWKRLNPAWSRTLGFTQRELLSRPVIEFVHPEDREATLSARANLKRGEPLLTLTNRYRCKDGTYRWFEWKSVSDVQRQLVYAVARDVTAEREGRRALRELNESLNATLNSMADGVIATDAQGTVVRMNPVAETLTRWGASEAKGRSLGDVFTIVHADTHASAPLPFERTLQQGLASQGTEHTILVGRDGTELPIAFSRASMRDSHDRVSGAVIVFRDMTVERQARLEQERLQRQLVLADRMASVGTLAAGVGHEINNPLTFVMANLDMVIEELRSADAASLSAHRTEWLEMLEEARYGSERIRRIVRGLKTFSRAEEERRAPLELRPALELAVDMAFNEIRHRARLVKDYGPTPLVEADDSRLGQLFVNLLVNAAQAVGEGDAQTNEIRIVTLTDPSGNAVVEIRDTGPGIPEALLDRVFDPFFTTKAVGVGTGLGLAICHGIVSSMGGRITAGNREGGGAVFRVTLPPASDQPGAAQDAPHPTYAQAARAAVLVVDDEPAVGVIMTRVLRGYEVTSVTTAKAALALIDSGAAFDVILSDVMMPEMSGMELYSELLARNTRWAERMVFVTGGAFTPAAKAFLDSVANERIDKPFEPAAVRALVERFVK